MTERPDDSGHLTPEQLDERALRAAADTDPDEQQTSTAADLALDGHLASCAACRSALGDQVAVRAVLRRVPRVGPMPPDVAARIDAALSAAPRPGSSVAAATAGGTVLPMPEPGARRRGLAWLADSRLTKSLVAAAAVAVIGVGGYAAINGSSSGAGGSSASGADKGAAGAAAAPGTPSFDLAHVTARASGTAYTKAGIDAQVTKQLTAGDSKASVTSESAGDPSTLTTPAGLQACLNALGAPSAVPQLVDLATYEGRPAAVLVLPAAAGGREIWVVSRTCAPQDDGTAYYGLLK